MIRGGAATEAAGGQAPYRATMASKRRPITTSAAVGPVSAIRDARGLLTTLGLKRAVLSDSGDCSGPS